VTTLGMSHAAIVTSLHGRSGKTLLARTLVDYFLLSGGRPDVFDTDSVEWKLHDLFPGETRVVDLAIARDQMVLFDTLAKPSSEMRVVDLTHSLHYYETRTLFARPRPTTLSR